MQQWLQGFRPDDLICANTGCRKPFPPDPSQPAKRYCCERCRTINNNALIAKRAGKGQPEPWQTISPESMTDEHWTELACFAGGCQEGAGVFIAQYTLAVRAKAQKGE